MGLRTQPAMVGAGSLGELQLRNYCHRRGGGNNKLATYSLGLPTNKDEQANLCCTKVALTVSQMFVFGIVSV